MIKTFTLDDVLNYVYDEIEDPVEKLNIEMAIERLAEFYRQALEIKDGMFYNLEEPSDQVTDNILNYSKSLNLHLIAN